MISVYLAETCWNALWCTQYRGLFNAIQRIGVVPKGSVRHLRAALEQCSNPPLCRGLHGITRCSTQIMPNLPNTLPMIIIHSGSPYEPTTEGVWALLTCCFIANSYWMVLMFGIEVLQIDATWCSMYQFAMLAVIASGGNGCLRSTSQKRSNHPAGTKGRGTIWSLESILVAAYT